MWGGPAGRNVDLGRPMLALLIMFSQPAPFWMGALSAINEGGDIVEQDKRC